MKNFKDRSRSVARSVFWGRHEKDTYNCPDCGRGGGSLVSGFEVHHKNGNPMDNSPENLVALCRTCHNLREGKKPSITQIERLRDAVRDEAQSQPIEGKPTVYLAGSMDDDSAEHDTWRASVLAYGDRGREISPGSPIEFKSPTEVVGSHGCGIVEGIAASDMSMIDESDAILAYFEKERQVGTLTELVYAVTIGKPALVVFHRDLVPIGIIDEGVHQHNQSPEYWFLINFLATDEWNGFDTHVEIALVDSRYQIGDAVQNWQLHQEAVKAEKRRRGRQ